MGYTLSDDGDRAVEQVAFGFACYAGESVDNEFRGNHVGLVRDLEAAERFLVSGELPPDVVKR